MTSKINQLNILTLLLFACLSNTQAGNYYHLNVESDEALPFTNKLSKGKLLLTWKSSGICEQSTDLENWLGVGKGRRYIIKPTETRAFFRVRSLKPRAVKVFIPSEYDPAKTKYPLIINLHGFTGNGEMQESYFSLKELADELGFIFCAPDGLPDSKNQRRWNASDACCGARSNLPDDSSFLRKIINSSLNKLSIAENRIYVIGFSNGAFMSYRMALDHSDIIAAIAPIAGLGPLDSSKISLINPVSILNIHATNDAGVPWQGAKKPGPWNTFYKDIPGVEENIKNWVTANNCTEKNVSLKALNIDSNSPDKETDIFNYKNTENGCEVELWKVNGSEHNILFTPEANRRVVDWLFKHPKIK